MGKKEERQKIEDGLARKEQREKDDRQERRD